MATTTTKQVAWPEGGGTITVSSSDGRAVSISSTANEGIDRETTLTFATEDGQASAVLAVAQPGLREPLRDSAATWLRSSEQEVLTALKGDGVERTGIGILKLDGTIVDYAEIVADESLTFSLEDSVGVAVYSPTYGTGFVIHPGADTQALFCGGGWFFNDVPAVYPGMQWNYLLGYENTEALVSVPTVVSAGWAASVAWKKTFLDGRQAYLPSSGEATIISETGSGRLEKINALMEKMGGEPLTNNIYWTSTRIPPQGTYVNDWVWIFNPMTEYLDGGNGQGYYRVRAVAKL